MVTMKSMIFITKSSRHSIWYVTWLCPAETVLLAEHET